MYDLILLTAEAPDLAVFPWIAAAIFMQTATSLFTAKKARKQQKKALAFQKEQQNRIDNPPAPLKTGAEPAKARKRQKRRSGSIMSSGSGGNQGYGGLLG
jgi:hypothetical protein